MNTHRLATAAALLALPVSAVVTPASAAARSQAKQAKSHHVAGSGHKAHHAKRPTRKSRSVSFTARVVRSGANGLVVRTANGKVLSFSKKQIKPGRAPKRHKSTKGRGHHRTRAVDLQVSSGNVVVNVLGLQPGALVQITETTDPDGTVTITIALPPLSSQEQASGVVGEVGSDAFTVQTSDGSALRLHMAGDALSGLNLHSCDTVELTYHQNAGILIADKVTDTGSTTAGECAPTYEARGAITRVSADGLTISTDQGPVSFGVDPSSDLTSGFQAGDVVDVSYTKNADGTLSATGVQFVEEDASGQVTSVTTSSSGGSLTIADDKNGQSETFVADPNHGVHINARAFNGVSVGDQIELSYHQSAGQLVADVVTEQ